MTEIDFAREKFKAKVLQYKKMPDVPIILSMSVCIYLNITFLNTPSSQPTQSSKVQVIQTQSIQ